MRRRVALFGGTFDPVHHGHLRSALELRETLALDTLHLLPARQPALREQPGASAAQRLHMLQLALQGEPGLRANDCELGRDGASYTVDTLRRFRDELGAEASLIFVLGSDAFAALDRWKDWRELLRLAHLLVLQRPGAALPETGAVADLLVAHRAAPAQLSEAAAGAIVPMQFTPLAIAASDIRTLVATGRSPRFLLPDPVWDYIRQQGLYGYAAGRSAATEEMR